MAQADGVPERSPAPDRGAHPADVGSGPAAPAVPASAQLMAPSAQIEPPSAQLMDPSAQVVPPPPPVAAPAGAAPVAPAPGGMPPAAGALPPGATRTAAERLEDHGAIDRLADELLPALIAKLGASGLGELEVREGSWHVRLRMPADGRAGRRGGAGSRGAGQGDPGRVDAGRADPARSDPRSSPAAAFGSAGATAPARFAPASEPGATARGEAAALARDPGVRPQDPAGPALTVSRVMATSPAVGFYRPRKDLAPGARVRAGDRLGSVDVLGVPHEVAAPVDGIVGTALVEPGDPVEYGQDVVEIRLLDGPAGRPHEEVAPRPAPGEAGSGRPTGTAAPDPTPDEAGSGRPREDAAPDPSPPEDAGSGRPSMDAGSSGGPGNAAPGLDPADAGTLRDPGDAG